MSLIKSKISSIVKICDVTLRDGIQNLKSNNNNPNIPLNKKIQLIQLFGESNINRIEIGSNVSHKIIEMKNTHELVSVLESKPKSNYYLLVPNYKKYLETINWSNIQSISHLSLITACSESFIKKNTQMSFNQNIDDINQIIKNLTSNIKIRIYISTCFGCPFEGKFNSEHYKNVEKIFDKFVDNDNVEEIVISDTIGSYDMNLLSDYMKTFDSTKKVSLHIHSNPNDSNIKNILEKYIDSLVSIDTSIGNIGGCPSVGSNVKPNLNTYIVAQYINEIMGQTIYELDKIYHADLLIQNHFNLIKKNCA